MPPIPEDEGLRLALVAEADDRHAPAGERRAHVESSGPPAYLLPPAAVFVSAVLQSDLRESVPPLKAKARFLAQ